MNRPRLAHTLNTFAIFLLLHPYMVGNSSDDTDTASTQIGFAAGTGSYAEVSRDCNGRVLDVNSVSFNEAAVSVDHYTPVLHLGLKAGVIPEEPAAEILSLPSGWTFDGSEAHQESRGPVYYVTPTVGFNTTYVGIDVGYVFPDQQYQSNMSGIPAGSLRLGRDDGFHFRFRLADDLPMVTGGPGVMNMGFGFNLGRPRHTLWLGWGGGPYDGVLFGSQAKFPLSDAVDIHIAGSVGARDAFEYGLSAGLRVRS